MQSHWPAKPPPFQFSTDRSLCLKYWDRIWQKHSLNMHDPPTDCTMFPMFCQDAQELYVMQYAAKPDTPQWSYMTLLGTWSTLHSIPINLVKKDYIYINYKVEKGWKRCVSFKESLTYHINHIRLYHLLHPRSQGLGLHSTGPCDRPDVLTSLSTGTGGERWNAQETDRVSSLIGVPWLCRKEGFNFFNLWIDLTSNRHWINMLYCYILIYISIYFNHAIILSIYVYIYICIS